MYHIINKLLLINNINLIGDIIKLLKEYYIMCSAVIISPPRPEEWNNNNKSELKMSNGIVFKLLYTHRWNWYTCIHSYFGSYSVIYRIDNNTTVYTNLTDFWYNKNTCYKDNVGDDCCDYLMPMYYFPPN